MARSSSQRRQAISGSLRAVWSKLWLVGLVAVICTATAFAYSNSQTRLYSASVRLMYEPPTDISDPGAGTSSVNTDTMAIQLQSVSSSLLDPQTREAAEGELSKADASLDYSVSATVIIPEVNTSSATFPNMVEITAETTSSESSAAIANAYADAAIALRKESQQKRFRTAQRVVQDQLDLRSTPQSKLTADYAILVQQLRNLQIAEATSTGDFVVIIPAEPSPDPVSPQPVRSAALGLVGGAVVGVVLVFALGRLDTRVRGHRDVAQALGMPILGRVPRSREDAQSGDLAALARPDGAVSESLRMLRSNLEWANVDGDVRTLLFTSCLKGEGKTTTACNLAVALARAGKRVVVVDGDLRAPRVHMVFGLPNAVGLTSLLRGAINMTAALKAFPLPANTKTVAPAPLSQSGASAVGVEAGGVSLRIITSGPLPPDPGEVVASRRLGDVLENVRQIDADYVFIDAPPILSVGDAAALSAHADGIVVVVNVERTRAQILADGRELLEALPCRKVGVVVVGERIEYQHYYHA